MIRSTYCALVLGLSLLVACNGPVITGDAGFDARVPSCSSDLECDNGIFCDGAEVCNPSSPDADQRGCVAGAPPCPSDMRCEERAQICSDCSNPDLDGDGADAIACGGDDCDDEDPHRYPGALELCDPEGRDEDCDPETLGHDRDDDGFVSDQCCNIQPDGTLRCGRDCADDSRAINPDAIEVCNGEDDDCDGFIDEGLPHVIYPDEDGDGFGVSERGMSACILPPGGGFSFLGGDCDDGAASINPGARETCDGIDNDCDGAIDEGCACPRSGEVRICGHRAPGGGLQIQGACQSGEQLCLDGTWTECIGDQGPRPEFCDGVDDDCDGLIDEGVRRRFYLDADRDGFGDPRRPVDACTRPVGHVRNADDCDDADPDRWPGADERCNGVDDDCDGLIDEGADEACREVAPVYVCIAGECVEGA